MVRKLDEAGLRVGIIWECALKGRTAKGLDTVEALCVDWLGSQEGDLEIHGDEKGIPVRVL